MLDHFRPDDTTPILPPRKRPFWGVIVAVVVILLLLLGWALLDSRNTYPNIASDFTLNTYDGNTLRLSDLKGKVVVLNFWATWCAPCRDEAPNLQALWQKYKDRGVMFIGVDQADKPEAALAYLNEFKINYPNGPDNGIVSTYRVQGLPTTIIINRDGVITDAILAAIEPSDLAHIIALVEQSQ
jgi:cytochrome c biogenesis protein CcmG, thiol:disulfide interchange protein DsbE